MAVKIGSARISENGTINGTKGDQTGNEVGTQDWYLHSKGWLCCRAHMPEMREKIAWFVEKACANNNFGYGQNDRDSSYTALKAVNFDPTKITQKVNVDCSLLVLEALRYAGVGITYNGENPFYTGNMAQRIEETGLFDVYSDAKHCSTSEYLLRGDILVTRIKGHTVTVLSNGLKTAMPEPVIITSTHTLQELQYGDKNKQVRALQAMLKGYGYTVKGGIDGDFGTGTRNAVIAYQTDNAAKCGTADGIVGKKTWACLLGTI